MYKKIDLKDIEYLKSFISDERIFCFDEINENYSHDELSEVKKYPDVVIVIDKEEEVSKILKYANNNNIAIVARGSGTGLVGACVSLHSGIILDFTKMNKILELDEENLTLTVEPGVLLMDISSYVEERGYFYPPDPGEKSATIAGNISTNAGGMRAVKYGVTRDYVRGLRVCLANGDFLDLGGKVVKNSSGYALKDLVVGSEGTLCVITKAILKLLPLPPITISLLSPFKSMKDALNIVPKIIISKVNPTAIEYMSKETILYAEDYLGKKFPDTKSDSYILLTFDGGSMSQLEDEISEVSNLLLNNNALDIFIVDTDERKKSVWSARGAFLEAIKASTTEMDECDVVVPRNKINAYIEFTHIVSKDENIRIPSFGHAGDGNLHIYLCKDNLTNEKWEEKKIIIFKKLYDKAFEMKGFVSGEHGIGYSKKQYFKAQVDDNYLKIMKGIKNTFDPNNIINPDKIL